MSAVPIAPFDNRTPVPAVPAPASPAPRCLLVLVFQHNHSMPKVEVSLFTSYYLSCQIDYGETFVAQTFCFIAPHVGKWIIDWTQGPIF